MTTFSKKRAPRIDFGVSWTDLDPHRTPSEYSSHNARGSGDGGVTALWQLMAVVSFAVAALGGLFMLVAGAPIAGTAMLALSPLAGLGPATVVVMLNRSARIEAALLRLGQ